MTYGEAALFASVRADMLHVAGFRERMALGRARRRLVRAWHAATTRPPDVSSPSTPSAVADERSTPIAAYAEALTIPRWTTAAVVTVVGVVEFLFWWTLGRQFVPYDDTTSPEALQAIALALLFPAVVYGGARTGAACGHLVALPPGVPRAWHRLRSWSGAAVVAVMAVAMAMTAAVRFAGEGAAVGATPVPTLPLTLAFFVVPLLTLVVHAFASHPEVERRRLDEQRRTASLREDRRQWSAIASRRCEWHLAAISLETQIHRVAARYAREVAAGETRLLGHRARYGRVEAPLDDPGPAGIAHPPSWLGIRVPTVESALVLSRRVLGEYGPPSPTGPGCSEADPAPVRVLHVGGGA